MIGGAIAIIAVTGIVTYQSALNAVKDDARQTKLAEIDTMHQHAKMLSAELNNKYVEAVQLVANIPTLYENDFARFDNIEKNLSKSIKTGEYIELQVDKDPSFALSGIYNQSQAITGPIFNYNVIALQDENIDLYRKLNDDNVSKTWRVYRPE